MLTLHPYMYFHEGSDLYQNRRVIGFKVLGLPSGKEAWIAEIHRTWQILRRIDGVQGKWSGSHATPEEALKALQAII